MPLIVARPRGSPRRAKTNAAFARTCRLTSLSSGSSATSTRASRCVATSFATSNCRQDTDVPLNRSSSCSTMVSRWRAGGAQARTIVVTTITAADRVPVFIDSLHVAHSPKSRSGHTIPKRAKYLVPFPLPPSGAATYPHRTSTTNGPTIRAGPTPAHGKQSKSSPDFSQRRTLNPARRKTVSLPGYPPRLQRGVRRCSHRAQRGRSRNAQRRAAWEPARRGGHITDTRRQATRTHALRARTCDRARRR